MKNSLLALTILALVFSLAMPTVSFARRGADDGPGHDVGETDDSGNDSPSDLDDSDEDNDDSNKADRLKKKCDKLVFKLEKKLGKLGVKTLRPFARMEVLETKLVEFETKAEGLGLDTAELDGYIKEFSKKLDEYQAEYQQYIDGAKSIASNPCVDGKDASKSKIKQAKGVLKEAKSAGRGVREYFRKTIRPEVFDLVKQSDGQLTFNASLGS